MESVEWGIRSRYNSEAGVDLGLTRRCPDSMAQTLGDGQQSEATEREWFGVKIQ